LASSKEREIRKVTKKQSSIESGILVSGERRAVRELARQALATSVGERLPTATFLQDSANVGSGTVQKAFQILEDLGALKTKARGHMGRFLQEKDLAQLWGLSGFPEIRAVLTPPGSPETYGLSEGLRHEFAKIGLPVEIEYVVGARERAEKAIKSPFSLAFVSKGASTALEALPQIWGRVMLGSGSYYSKDSIVVLSKPNVDLNSKKIKIGVDRRSHDHKLLTIHRFGELETLKLVDVGFHDVPAALLRGDIDAGVWHRMLLIITPELAGLKVSPLAKDAGKIMSELGPAVALFDGRNPVMKSVVEAISWESVVKTQANWMKNFAKNPAGPWFR
jgi:hypothetical protein